MLPQENWGLAARSSSFEILSNSEATTRLRRSEVRPVGLNLASCQGGARLMYVLTTASGESTIAVRNHELMIAMRL